MFAEDVPITYKCIFYNKACVNNNDFCSTETIINNITLLFDIEELIVSFTSFNMLDNYWQLKLY